MSWDGNGSVRNHILDLFSSSPQSIAGYVAVREHLLAAVARWRNQDGSAEFDSPPGDSASFLSPELVDYFHQLEETVIRNSADLSSTLCMGHMSGICPHFMTLVGELIVVLNQNLVKREASPSLTQVEVETLAALHRVVYGQSDDYYRRHSRNHDSTLGLITSGGTLSNLTALWIARNLCFAPTDDFPGIEATGVAQAFARYACESAVIVGSRLMHYSIEKAAALLGLGTQGVLLLPVDGANRLDVQALQDCVTDCAARKRRIIAIVGVAGTTECGSIDPLDAIAEVALQHRIFFHVDAAWGGPLLFSGRYRRYLAGIEHADSVVLDGHKQMYLPVAASALLLRDPRSARVIEKQSHYMLQEGSGDLGRRTLEGSRNGAALFFHAGLQLIGAEGYGFLMEENLRKAQLMAGLIQKRPEFELLTQPETNILLFRGLPAAYRHSRPKHFSTEENAAINTFNERLQKRQSQTGRSFVSRTTIALGKTAQELALVALRAVITNPLMEERDVQSVLDDQVSIMAELENQPQPEAVGAEIVRR
jgi:putative pyridoxal-dependent aspartate 1-decarboxylase